MPPTPNVRLVGQVVERDGDRVPVLVWEVQGEGGRIIDIGIVTAEDSPVWSCSGCGRVFGAREDRGRHDSRVLCLPCFDGAF